MNKEEQSLAIEQLKWLLDKHGLPIVDFLWLLQKEHLKSHTVFFDNYTFAQHALTVGTAHPFSDLCYMSSNINTTFTLMQSINPALTQLIALATAEYEFLKQDKS